MTQAHGLQNIIGAPVALVHTLDNGHKDSEYGRIIHAWFDHEMQTIDCYVAFFGNAFPSGKPTQKPYVLRYFLSSLKILTQPD